jgi:Holliday junction DNA helicase RuvA
LQAQGSDWAIIKVGGVSFRVYVPHSTLNKLGAIGEEVGLHTHLYLREDHVALYGFTSPEELTLFQTLLGISGVGPKAALAMLSAMNPGQLSLAIASGDVDLLSQAAGVGKKLASRLVLELKGKLGHDGVPASKDSAEVIAALTSLGYSAAEATRALASLPDSPDLTLVDKIKLALQSFGSK